MKKILLISCATMALSGCSAVAEVADKAADVNDEAVRSAEFMICNGASIGAVRRQYDSPKKVEAWRKLCLKDENDAPFRRE